MKFPEYPKTSGIGTTGAAGCIILAGVIWGQISAWWLIAGVFLLCSGIGQENKK
jgi:hypothetical protein